MCYTAACIDIELVDLPLAKAAQQKHGSSLFFGWRIAMLQVDELYSAMSQTFAASSTLFAQPETSWSWLQPTDTAGSLWL